MTRHAALLALPLLALGSCATLQSEPWYQFTEGSSTLGMITGGGVEDYEMELELEGESSGPPGQPAFLEGVTDSRTTDLDAEYVLAVELQHWATDHWTVGGGLGWNRFDASRVELAGLSLQSETFGYMRYFLSARYFFDALDTAGRLRPFLGANLAYIDGLDFDYEVTYPETGAGRGGTQTVGFDGDGYYGYNLVGGLALLLRDDTFVQIGVSYEQNLGTTGDTLELDSPDEGPGEVSLDLDPNGLIWFIGLTYSF